MNILNRLRGSKTAAEWEASIGELEKDGERIRAAIAAAEKELERCLFDGDEAGQRKAKKALESGREELDTHQRLLEGSRNRHGEAVEQERQAEIEAARAAHRDLAERIRKEEREALKAFDALAVQLADTAEKITEGAAARQAANAKAKAEGWDDMLIPNVYSELRDRCQAEFKAHYARAAQPLPNNLPGAIDKPTFGLVVPGYWPKPAVKPDGRERPWTRPLTLL